MLKQMRPLALLVILACGIAQPAWSAELIVNGNLETGSLDPWGRFGDGIGLTLGGNNSPGVLRWDAAQPGVPGPGVGFFTPSTAGAHGSFVARGVWSDDNAPGSDLLMGLWQSFNVPAGATSAQLSFDMFTQGNLNPANGAIADVFLVTGSSSPFTGRNAGDAYSVPGTAVASVGSATQLTSAFSNSGNVFIPYVFDVQSILAGGGTFTLAFQMWADAGGAIAWGIDNVRLQVSTGSSSVPEPGGIALLALGLTVLGFWRRRTSGLRRT